jgi:hypothetical protein
MLRVVGNLILVLFAAFGSLWVQGQEKRKAEIEIVEAAVNRSEGKIMVDGVVRNTGNIPLESMNLVFGFVSSGRKVMTERKYPIDEAYFEPGDETSFHIYIQDVPRAVHVLIAASDAKLNDIKVKKEGPYGIP